MNITFDSSDKAPDAFYSNSDAPLYVDGILQMSRLLTEKGDMNDKFGANVVIPLTLVNPEGLLGKLVEHGGAKAKAIQAAIYSAVNSMDGKSKKKIAVLGITQELLVDRVPQDTQKKRFFKPVAETAKFGDLGTFAVLRTSCAEKHAVLPKGSPDPTQPRIPVFRMVEGKKEFLSFEETKALKDGVVARVFFRVMLNTSMKNPSVSVLTSQVQIMPNAKLGDAASLFEWTPTREDVVVPEDAPDYSSDDDDDDIKL